jgi:hypothetical protein
MRCYINFVDEEIMPLYTMFDGTSRTKIRFEDLWLLFRAGELIYASHNSDVRPRHGHVGNRGRHSEPEWCGYEKRFLVLVYANKISLPFV